LIKSIALINVIRVICDTNELFLMDTTYFSCIDDHIVIDGCINIFHYG